MQTYAVDEHYNVGDAVTLLQQLSLDAIDNTKEREDVQQLADVKVGQFHRPKTWRMCEYNTSGGGMEEVQFRVQGIIIGKELPPIGGNLSQLKRARRYMRQNVKIYGGQSDVFADAVQAIDRIFIAFAGQFQDGQLEPWAPSVRDGNPVIEANTRYFTPKQLCDEDAVRSFDEYVDPNGTLRLLMEDDFVCGPDNEVEYMEKLKPLGDNTMRKISPAQFKIGDIVEAVLTFVCYPTQKGTFKMSIGLKALAMLDHSHRDRAAILQMRERQKVQSVATKSGTLKRRSPYGNEIAVDTTARLSRMRIDEDEEDQTKTT
ncbi:hypothetical protein MD484_g8056, partial [Candolleomyces efflorescens]